MNQICIPGGETCVDCTEYAAAFSCLQKIKVSGMSRLSELETISILDNKCEDILIPISTISCEKSPESFSLSLKDLLDIIGHTSVGERKSFPDKEFTAEGQVEEYELTVFNPSETRDMQMTYFAHWSAVINIKSDSVRIESKVYIDDEDITEYTQGSSRFFGPSISLSSDGTQNGQDAGTLPLFYTKIVGPKDTTKIKMTLECTNYPVPQEGFTNVVSAETIQLMITGTTR